eukprot:sb/3476270/
MLSEQEIERWLDKQGVLIGYELHRIAIGEETALQQILKDGIVCCRIINCLIPNKIQKVSGEKSSEGFRENFQEFRKALGELGITPVSLTCELIPYSPHRLRLKYVILVLNWLITSHVT